MIHFSLVHTKAEKIHLSKVKTDSDKFELQFGVEFHVEDDTMFVIHFIVSIASEEEHYQLDLEYVSFFKTDTALTQEFKTSPIPSVNAPAIAYPFLRSFVSTLTLNAGYNPVILPTINFQKLVREQQEQ
jgi:preprotein translocase subunit SecB